MTVISNYLTNKCILLLAIVAIGLSPLAAAEKGKATCDYRTFNIKTNNKATAGELLSEIAEICDFSIVVKDMEAEKVLAKNLSGINIKNLSLDEIFQIVISDNDLYYTYEKNFLKISALTTKSFKVDYISSIRKGEAGITAYMSVDPRKSEEKKSNSTEDENAKNYISSNESFDFWSTISTELQSVLNTGAEVYKTQGPIINPKAGIITITATKKQLDRVSEYIDLLIDRLHRQVLIDVSIISVLLSNNNKTGVDWKNFSLKFDSSTIFNNSNQGQFYQTTYDSPPNPNNLTVINDALFSIGGLIDFLGSNGETKVVSSPKVLTMNNQQALITIGDNINYRIPEKSSSTETGASLGLTYLNYSVFIGVLLNITPEISENNEIILRINPSVSNFKYSDDDVRTLLPREIAPDTSEKKLSTVVKVKDGSTIILGGLITNNKGGENSSVPLLSNIPLVGEAFKHSSDTLSTSELIFVITPRIIGAKGTDKATLKDLGFSQKLYE